MYRLPHRLSRIVVSLVLAVVAATLSVLATQPPAAAEVPQGPPTQTGGVDGQVYATLVVGDTVYVGGDFANAQVQGGTSTPRASLAAFDLDTGALLGSWRADANGVVYGLASAGGYLYVGGTYRTIGGVAQARLARVSLATGAVDTGFRPRVNAYVRSVSVGGGAAYIGGQFTAVGGVPQAYLGKVDATSGARVAAFDAQTNGLVNSVALSPDGSRLAVGGRFTTLSGSAREGLGLVDVTDGDSVGSSFASSVSPMLTVSWSDDGTSLYAGSGGRYNRAGRWNPNTGAVNWRRYLGGDVQAIDFYDGDVYVGFHDQYEGDTTTHLVVYDNSGVINTAFRPVFNQFWGVRTISAGPWGLIIGGQFTRLSDVWAHNWAFWPSDRTTPTIAVGAPATSAYGENVEVTVSVPGAQGTVTFDGAGVTDTETLANGSATFALPSTTAAGAYTLTVGYSGDIRHTATTTTTALTVTKAGTRVRTKVVRKATSKRRGKVKVRVVPETTGGTAPTGTVRLKLHKGGKHRTVKARPLNDTTVTIKLPRVAAGSWKLKAIYSGDADHQKARHVTTFKVTRKR
jgi:WD40 repeat protein